MKTCTVVRKAKDYEGSPVYSVGPRVQETGF
jgi:hypothetical protein